MATNKLKVVLSILRELDDGSIPSASAYDLSDAEYYKILDAMQDDGLIKGLDIVRAQRGIVIVLGENAQLTIRGMEYMNANSNLMKTYKGLKEIRDWLPF
jgi:hypothetical protein